MPRRGIRIFTARRSEELRLLDDASFVSELVPICFPVTGSGVVEVAAGWLYCNGATTSRTGPYKRLFDEVGTSYNIGGEAGTDFRLPDFRGRSPLAHADSQTGTTRVANAGTVGNATVPGGVGGADTVALSKTHLPPHTHTVGTLNISGGSHGHGPGTIGTDQRSGDGSQQAGRNAHDGGVGPVTSVNLPVGGNVDAAAHAHGNGDFSGASEDGTAAGLGSGTPTHNNAHPHLPATGMVIRA